MSRAVQRRQELQDLIAMNEDFETEMSHWQQGAEVSPEDVRRVQRDYGKWYVMAKAMLGGEQLEKFVDMYEGGAWTNRVRAFLVDPFARNDFYNPGQENPLISEWKVEFQGTVRDSLVTQRQILIQELHAESDIIGTLDELADISRRLPDYLRTLKNKASTNVPAPNITKEKELQIVVLAILRLLYVNVSDEDPASKHAGGSSIPDFMIRDIGVAVETKMVREGQKDKDVGAELLIDWGRYPKHPDCQAIFAIVYDPKEVLDNPNSLEIDLSQDGPGIPTRVVVIR
ncbi:PD-(D/E)XK nuclease domain-containing protein [Actinomadura geliboluensis]